MVFSGSIKTKKGRRNTMYRQAAFETGKSFLKGNLHTHTTRSDGRGTPEEVIAQYKHKGYDFLALTDHNTYNYHHFGQEGITIIPGMEIDRNLRTPYGHKSFHTVCIGPVTENGYSQDERFNGGGYFDHPMEFQEVLDEVHQKNNLTIYCHPEWSKTVARDFEDLKGNFAMEIWNSGCALEDDCDTNAPCWDEILCQGKRIFGVATDDGHHAYQNGVGWVMVKSENKVESILKALEAGAFYASTGPEIKDFYVEEGKAVITCSPGKYAGFVFGNRPNRLAHESEGVLVEKAAFPIPENCPYVRGVVKDEMGRMAWTNPIFLEDVK